MTATLQVSSDEINNVAEVSEQRAYELLVGGAPAALKARYRLITVPFGGGLAFVSGVERRSLIFNRVLGLGWSEPVSAKLLGELDDLYRSHGVKTYAVEVSSSCRFQDAVSRLRAAGFMRFTSTTFMSRASGAPVKAQSRLVVRRAAPDEASVFADLCCEVFRLGEPFGELLGGSFEREGARHWLALDGERPVAAAATFRTGETVDWIGWVGTLPSHRGLGAQAALTEAQLRESEHRGARRVTLEVATEASGAATPSLRNYLRMGWHVGHVQTTFLRRLRG